MGFVAACVVAAISLSGAAAWAQADSQAQAAPSTTTTTSAPAAKSSATTAPSSSTTTTTKPAAPAAASATPPSPGPPAKGVLPPAGKAIADHYIVTLRTPAATAPATAEQLGAKYGATVDDVYQHALSGFSAQMSASEAQSMAADPTVATVEQDSVVHATDDQVGATGDQSGATWGLDRIDQQNLPLNGHYVYNATAPSVHAYMIDTGIRISHNDFGGRASIGADFIGDGQNGNDCAGHGTHTAGTVGGTTYGVAKNVQLVAVRVLDCNGSGSVTAVINGINWVTGDVQAHRSVSNPWPAVASMSLGTSGVSTSLNNAVESSIAAGVPYAVAAGNSSVDACTTSPAGAPDALTVAASDSNDNPASFTNIGSCVDLYGPGVSVTSDWNTSNSATNTISGTSMATPHVAGSVALYLSEHPTDTPAQVTSAIVTNASTFPNANPGTAKLLDYTGFITAQAPSKPLNVAASASKAATTVSWSAPTFDGGANITGYTVTTVQDDTRTCTWSSGPLSCAVTGLTNGTSYTFTVHATNSTAGNGPESDPSAAVTPSADAGTFTAIDPARILDTRNGTGLSGAFDGSANRIRDLQVTGQGGLPSTGVDAVVLNVTVDQPSTGGWLTLFPTGQPFPLASNLNFVTNQTVPNLVLVKVGTGGKVTIANTALPSGPQPSAGTVHVIADVVGWTSNGSSPLSGFMGLTPSRILDTRNAGGAFGANEIRDLQVTGAGGVPNSNVDAVVLNMTVTQPTQPGFLTVWPAGESLPGTSNLNFTANGTVANLVVAKLSSGGKVSIKNSANGTTHVIADVVGYFSSGGASLTSIAPARVLDTRNSGTPIGPNATISVDPAAGAPLPPHGSYTGVVVNLTAVGPTQSGWLTAFPSDKSLPTASNLNFAAGQTVPNLVMIAVGSDGKFKIANTALPSSTPPSGTVHVIVDVVGYYTS
jgi:subtilisin family serine protease